MTEYDMSLKYTMGLRKLSSKLNVMYSRGGNKLKSKKYETGWMPAVADIVPKYSKPLFLLECTRKECF